MWGNKRKELDVGLVSGRELVTMIGLGEEYGRFRIACT